MSTDVDVVIIGAGPVGLFAVFACGQLGMRAAVIDALADPGGQLTALYPEKPIYDIPGRPQVRADRLVSDLVEQAAPYRPAYFLGQEARSLSEDACGVFSVETSKGETVRARAVVIAAGAGAFGPNRPPLKDIRDYETTSVFYHVAQRDRFSGKRLVIAGGGDSAVDWALSLAEVAQEVTVIHRRDKFRAHPANVAAMNAHPNINILTKHQLVDLKGSNGTLEGIGVGRIGGETTVLEADVLLALFGLASDISVLRDWDIAIEGKVLPVSAETCQTSRDGVFAIGDIAHYPGKLKLILTGFAEASLAAHSAHQRVFPGKAIHSEYSTTRGVPGSSENPVLQSA